MIISKKIEKLIKKELVEEGLMSDDKKLRRKN